MTFHSNVGGRGIVHRDVRNGQAASNPVRESTRLQWVRSLRNEETLVILVALRGPECIAVRAVGHDGLRHVERAKVGEYDSEGGD